MERFNRIVVIGIFALSVNSAFGAPVGYSVNSDEVNGDRLYEIDLETGASNDRGAVQSAVATFTDVEGLAFDPEGVLWGVDDQSLSLFPISTGNGTVDRDLVSPIRGLQSLSGNDFGMSFSCDGDLFVSSVADRALYRLSTSGQATLIGSLNANISALAAYGDPVRLYGLGNGLLDDNGTPDNRSLYEIDTATAATQLLFVIGNEASDYYQAGLSFDVDGRLWAITDRNGQGQSNPSQILELNLETSQARLQSQTQQTGFESLALAPPAGCIAVQPPLPPVPPPNRGDGLPSIPSLDAYGKLATILTLLMAGFMALRPRP